MIKVRRSTRGDFDELIAGMRQRDAEEVFASAGNLCAHEMQQRAGDSLTALDGDNRVIAIFGCSALRGSDTVGVPWLLGTNLLDRHVMSMCKQARKYIKAWLGDYEVLTNATSISNTVVIDWLKWLGFTFSYQFPGAVDPSVTFIQFSKRRTCATPQLLLQ